MTRMELRTRIGPDGVLTLNVPTGLSEANRKVKVIVEPANVSGGHNAKLTPEEWAQFVDEMAGALKGDLERPNRVNSKLGAC